jgi:hypothetical protein
MTFHDAINLWLAKAALEIGILAVVFTIAGIGYLVIVQPWRHR